MNQDVLEKKLLRPATRSALDELTSVPGIQPAPRRTAPRASKSVRIAIVHDWLVTYAGAEKVLEQIIACFPDADLFSLVDFLDDRSFLRGKPVTTSFIQKLPLARSKYRSYLPLMPLAIEQLDVSAYDVVISSSHAVAKGILTGPDQVHISYVHSPIRYAWDLQHQYLQQSKLTNGPKSALARLILHYMRNWDIRTSNSVDDFVANSAFIARRIKKVYQRDAQVIFPPVDVEAFTLCTEKEDFYLTASRMVPYKKIDLIVEAFARMPERKLVVIGDGPDMAKIRAKAGPNVEIMGYQPFEVLKDRMSRAKAFVFAAEEDFGISVVEAQACGTPVIAYGKGGALETVRDLSEPKPTGMFFDEQDTDSIIAAVNRFDELRHRFLPENCRGNAEQFSAAHFRERFFSQVRAAVPALHTATLPAYTPYRPAVQGAANVPRILAVDQSGVLGGAELSLLEIVKALRSRIEVVLFDDGPFNTALAKTGVEVTVLDAGALKNVRKQGGSMPKGQALKGLISLVRATAKRARKVDVIYANTQRAMVIGAVAGKLARRPVVWHLRDIVSAEHFGGKQLAIIKWCARLGLTHVIANSAASAQAFAKLTRFDSKRIDVVFNGIAAEPFDALRTVPQAVLRERLNLPRDAFLVGLVQPACALEGAACATRSDGAQSADACGAGRRGAVRRGPVRERTARLRRRAQAWRARAFSRLPARYSGLHVRGRFSCAYVDHPGAVRPRDRRGDARAAAGRGVARRRRARNHRRLRERRAVYAGRRACARRYARRIALERRLARQTGQERLSDRAGALRHAQLCGWGCADSDRRGSAVTR
ncbi:glycosyltransferase involved in cell wall biosynthesis [Paraburkholderia sp. 40]